MLGNIVKQCDWPLVIEALHKCSAFIDHVVVLHCPNILMANVFLWGSPIVQNQFVFIVYLLVYMDSFYWK